MPAGNKWRNQNGRSRVGQSAAMAACVAIDDGVRVQKVDYPKLRERLLKDEQMSEWKHPLRR
ncbi:MAG: hypothetical protein FJ388_05280 [Verrucomicrobia bacterium]|nr:hypothetical protein [Verrucomicrobiota bacterium]